MKRGAVAESGGAQKVVRIRVNTLSPTVVLSEALKLRIPSGRFALPQEIAAAAVFLASSGAEMINGADLLIDGGYTIV